MKTLIFQLFIIMSASNIFGQTNQDTIHFFPDLFPESGLFIRPDSLEDGVWIAFCKTNQSQIGLELHYKDGERNGKTIAYWPNGNMQQRGIYENGCLVGLNEKWYRDGTKESESFCIADDFKKHFYHCNLKNYWSGEGNQLVKDGNGTYIAYFDNLNVQSKGEYLNGFQEGEWIYYYYSGKIQYIDHFKNGKEDGEYIFYFINGQVRSQGLYLNGKQVGKWQNWYDDGKPEQLENRTDGKRDGEYKYWHRNGQLSYEGIYKLGKEDGIWKQWDETGKLISEVNYSNGVIIEEKNYR